MAGKEEKNEGRKERKLFTFHDGGFNGGGKGYLPTHPLVDDAIAERRRR